MFTSFDPFKLMGSGMALWADTARTLQSQYVSAVANAAQQGPGKLQWTRVEMPVLALKFDTSETQLRDVFQTAANININTWTHTAQLLDALPDWAQWPSPAASRAFTDLFDQWQDKASKTYE